MCEREFNLGLRWCGSYGVYPVPELGKMFIFNELFRKDTFSEGLNQMFAYYI